MNKNINVLSDEIHRMSLYGYFSASFSYPGENLTKIIPEVFLESKIDEYQIDYDRLFRSGLVWLYTTELRSDNEFEKARLLSDITGYYKAFGVEANGDRPDSLAAQLEFMHILIYKRLRLADGSITPEKQEKVDICLEAEESFCNEHLFLPALTIAKNILINIQKGFYADRAEELIEFIRSEQMALDGMKK